MPIEAKPIRTALFVPANRESWMRNAHTYGSDALIFDMESAIPQSELPVARKMVRSVLEDLGAGRTQMFVRINDIGSGKVEDDVRAILCKGLAGVLLPQIVDPGEVRQLDDILTRAERDAKLPQGRTIIWPVIESAQAVVRSYDIAAASKRVAHMGGGTSRKGDIVRSIGYRWTMAGMETLYLRSKILIEMRALGVPYPISAMWSEVGNHDGLRAFANQTRDIGYTGMQCIHPSHVPVINEIFTPTADEIKMWQEILQTMLDAQAKGIGAVRYRGELLDEAHIKTARQFLDLASKLGAL